MAPGADAVGLIHRQGHQPAGRKDVIEPLPGALQLQPLGGQVEQAQPVLPEAQQQGAALGPLQAAMQAGGGNTAALQLAHLILHQGHQRRDHHHQPLAHQRRQLIAEGFARPGGQHRQAVASGQQRFHHRPLAGPKVLPAEMAAEGLAQGIGLQRRVRRVLVANLQQSHAIAGAVRP